MRVDVQSAAGLMKRDIEQTVRALTSDDAVTILRRTFEDAGVLPSAVGQLGSGANSLADSVAAEPAESFESIRFRGAYKLALDMLEQEHARRGRHASMLLALFAVGVLATIALVVLGFIWKGSAAHIGGLVGLVPLGAIFLWYRYASRIAERVRGDLRTLAKVELRRS